MPAGSAPGERRGGRQKGALNKTTIERAMVEDRAVVQVVAQLKSATPGAKQAVEVLEQFMTVFAGMAAFYQPRPRNSPEPNPYADESKFAHYAGLTVRTARWLAPFQSPTYSTISVGPPPPPPRDESRNFTFTIFDERTRSYVMPGTDEAVDAAIGSELVRMTNGGSEDENDES